MTKRSDQYRLNAENCMQMAEAAHSEPAYNRYKRMEAAWLALAEEQDWLDGERSPVDPAPAEQKGQPQAPSLLRLQAFQDQPPAADRAGAEGKAMTTENRNNRWAPEEDDLFRGMAEAGIRPEVIAAKLNRSIQAVRARAYTIGLPLKWFKAPCSN